MAKQVFMDIVTGDDANDGLSLGAAVRTFARANTIAATGDIILIGGGVYPSTVVGVPQNLNTTSCVWMARGNADVILDWEGVSGALQWGSGCTIVNLKFRNVAPLEFFNVAGSPTFIGCVFYQRDGAANTGRGIKNAHGRHCTFYNLEVGHDRTTSTFTCKSCYFENVTTPLSAPNTNDYNAYPGNTETNGLDTDDPNTNPGFVDAAAEDFRLDPTDTIALDKFRTLGEFGGQIGAPGTAGPVYSNAIPQLRWIGASPAPVAGQFDSWVNDPNYSDPGGTGTTGVIVEDAGTFEPVVDLADNPAAESGRLLGPVWDFGSAPHSMDTFAFSKFIDGAAGALFDTNTSLPDEIEYRASNTIFSQTDIAPATWVTFQSGDQLDITEQYVQVALTYQTVHPNT